MVLRKDVQARRLRWTITDTTTSPDSRFLLYASISRYVHLVKIDGTSGVSNSVANITEVHEELDFMVCPWAIHYIMIMRIGCRSPA
jgi:DDB1- and CUL4-associated factor 11